MGVLTLAIGCAPIGTIAVTGTLRKAVDELCELVVGEDPARIEAIVARLRQAAGDACGPAGIFTLALSAIDIALWDIKGKALNQPLWKLLGGRRERVATYASGSLRRGLTDEQSARAARILVEKGFTEMKTQMALPGNPTPAQEVRRMRVVRDAIGPDIKLMCDINQRWRPEQAIDIGRRLGATWVVVGGFQLDQPLLAGAHLLHDLHVTPGPIAPDERTSGAAAYLRQAIITHDIAHDDRWARDRDAAALHLFRGASPRLLLRSGPRVGCSPGCPIPSAR